MLIELLEIIMAACIDTYVTLTAFNVKAMLV